MASILLVISAILALPAVVLPEGQLTQSESWLSHLANSPMAAEADPDEEGVVKPLPA